MPTFIPSLNDLIDQRRRSERQEALSSLVDEEANMIGRNFMTAFKYGMPLTGVKCIDRLVMLFTNAPSIRNVLLFPTMCPLDKQSQ